MCPGTLALHRHAVLQRTLGIHQPPPHIRDLPGHGVAHTQLHAIEPLHMLPHQVARLAEHVALPRRAEAVPHAQERTAQRADQALLQHVQPLTESLLASHHQFGRGRGRGRAQIGHEITDREIDFVAHGRDHRNGRRHDRARHTLLVEAPQVLQAAPATAHNQGIQSAPPVEHLDARHHLLGRPGALHHSRREDEMDVGKASRNHVQNITDGRPRGRGHHADMTRQQRQGALAVGLKEALRLEALLELLEAHLQGALPALLEAAHNDLVAARPLIDRHIALGPHLLSIRQAKGQVALVAAEEHGRNLGVLVLDREVVMP